MVMVGPLATNLMPAAVASIMSTMNNFLAIPTPPATTNVPVDVLLESVVLVRDKDVPLVPTMLSLPPHKKYPLPEPAYTTVNATLSPALIDVVVEWVEISTPV